MCLANFNWPPLLEVPYLGVPYLQHPVSSRLRFLRAGNTTCLNEQHATVARLLHSPLVHLRSYRFVIRVASALGHQPHPRHALYA